MKEKVIAYTDGSCYYKSTEGGYGVYLTYVDGSKIIKEIFLQKGFINTTISRMEVMAIINCFKRIEDKSLHVTIISDSEYATNCVNKNWLVSWKKKNWKGVKNNDLMIEYLNEFNKFLIKPKLVHIRGHQTGNDEHILGNNIADKLADYKQFETYEVDNILI